MITNFFKYILGALFSAVLLTSCLQDEDPGALQNDTRTYAIEGFDKISAGDAMDITLVKGAAFSMTAQGDSRNLDDISLNLHGATLEITYNKERNRQYTTYIMITMPELKGVNYVGAVNCHATGFDNVGSPLEVKLVGASNFDFDGASEEITLELSGASKAVIKGLGKKVNGTISGASLLSALDFSAEAAGLNVSGASRAWVNVSQSLIATASGASEVIYRGSPTVVANESGASTIRPE